MHAMAHADKRERLQSVVPDFLFCCFFLFGKAQPLSSSDLFQAVRTLPSPGSNTPFLPRPSWAQSRGGGGAGVAWDLNPALTKDKHK